MHPDYQYFIEIIKFIPRINPDENEPEIKELTVDQIINGGAGFPGLIPFIHRFLQDTATEIDVSCQIKARFKLTEKSN